MVANEQEARIHQTQKQVTNTVYNSIFGQTAPANPVRSPLAPVGQISKDRPSLAEMMELHVMGSVITAPALHQS